MKQSKLKEIRIEKTDKKIIGFCPQCGARIFTEDLDKPFIGEFNFCYKCGVSLEDYPPKPKEKEETKDVGD